MYMYMLLFVKEHISFIYLLFHCDIDCAFL